MERLLSVDEVSHILLVGSGGGGRGKGSLGCKEIGRAACVR